MRHAMRKQERELARRLAPEAVEPPEGLLERLKADIPEELPAIHRDGSRRDSEDGGGPGRVLRFPGTLAGLSTSVVLKAAAAVVLAVGAGFLALQVQRETPDLQVQNLEAQKAEEAMSGTGDTAPTRQRWATPTPVAGDSDTAAPADDGEDERTGEPAGGPETGRTSSGEERVAAPEESLGASHVANEEALEEAVDNFEAPPPAAGPAPAPVAEAPPAPASPPPSPPAVLSRPVPKPEPKSSERAAPVWVGSNAPITFRGGSPRKEGAAAIPCDPDCTELMRERFKKLPRGLQDVPETDVIFAVPEAAESTSAPARSGTNTVASPPPVRDLEIEVRHEEGHDETSPLSGAVVYLEDAAGTVRRAVAGAEGRAYFYDVPVGEYQVKAELEGFQAVTRRVTPPDAEKREMAMNLPLATVQEEIVVVGELDETVSESNTAMMMPTGSGTLTVEPGTPMPDAFGKRADRPPVPENPLVDTAYDALSTFGLDVDTGSYGLVRRHLMEGSLPAPRTVRIEELLNAFDYGDPAPTDGDFAITAQGAPSPFRPGLQLLRLGIKARVVTAEDRKPAALTFVVDISGSMQQPDKLDLAKQALGLLLDQLGPEDTVALVTYGSDAHLVLEPTADKEAVRRALDELGNGGSTNAEAGLRLGYEEARKAFRPGAVNRVILCSDGVANVGATDSGALLERVGDEARRGIELTTLGFGMGVYNDELMEQLADKGDGRYAYLDDVIEAHRVLVEELTGTVQTVARDARVQLELNPETVKRYRLLGYENRDIADHRFRYDDQDAGEIGSGHAVTVLYELELEPAVPDTAPLAVLRLRWWSVAEDRFVEIEKPVYRRDLVADWDRAAPALRWAALTARFAQALRGQAPMAELPELADRMRRLASRAWAGDDRRAELADLTVHAAVVDGALSQGLEGIRPASEPKEP
jgi:Ca-activated chloride channel family protein